MSVWGKAKAKAEELFGRAERIYGESHGDPAATVAGEAHETEAEADLEGRDAQRRHGRPDDDGLAGQGAVR